MKWLSFFAGAILIIAAAVFTAVRLGSYEVRRLAQQVRQLEQERERLMAYAQRLSAARRVAQVEVLRQGKNAAGQTVSTLLWQEIGPDGALGRPVAVEVLGSLAYFEAMVMKFEHQFVQEGDPQRGVSLALFRRIFGDQQTPESAPEIDRTARPPALAHQQSEFENELWKKFWEMVDDPKFAARYGVRVAQCEAPAVPVRAGDVWEVSLDAAGGLNLRKIAVRRPADVLVPPAKPGS